MVEQLGKVYPRACGGTQTTCWITNYGTGLSPRLRGNRERAARRYHFQGSIPAPAGEPALFDDVVVPEEVYPRACGGTYSVSVRPALDSGLSPRLRGNLLRQRQARPGQRSIPAPAGEPTPSASGPPWTAVYPRACGGTRGTSAYNDGADGLSPRLRGNHFPVDRYVCAHGSIPAPAGEPVLVQAARPAQGVYPRACGGTRLKVDALLAVPGLSPRLRGNPLETTRSGGHARSIPAPAGEPRRPSLDPSPHAVYPRACGEPRWGRACRACGRVYPRACGGTVLSPLASKLTSGLSPRLRGNHRCQHGRTVELRSIPAPAGEPMSTGWSRKPRAVYPRACGGTAFDRDDIVDAEGLSPRLRGNRRGGRHRVLPHRSIPAPAGEPRSRPPRRIGGAVYPRACGGTPGNVAYRAATNGLSPRLRGNRPLARRK